MLKKIKELLDITSDEYNSTLNIHINAGKKYLKNAGVEEDEKDDLYITAVAIYVKDIFDSTGHFKQSQYLEMIILQLRMASKK
ncbi:head-tail connector protein [Erysipelotrichaceae bacterium OttesenSCG-928-M19]|nr:head-tail connector protein [Erysipelotrichaceae bacterium OttesenSCG-928-M19]